MIGNKIKQERMQKNMTQSELGKAVGVSSSAIGMYEQNRRQPDISTLVELSNFLNVSTDYLLGRTDKVTTKDNKDTNNKHREDEVITIAAHHEGEEYTDEDKRLIEDFKQLVLSRKKNK